MKRKNMFFIFIFLIVVSVSFFYTSKKMNQEAKMPPAPRVQAQAQVSVPVAVVKKEEVKPSWVEERAKAIKAQAANLNSEVLKISLTAYQKAKERGLTSNPLLTIIDYSKPSSERRLWVVDVIKQKVIFNTLVAHGKNSGLATSSSFSNKHSSLKSSLGVFLTDETYVGKHGTSLKVQGLEAGINDNAYDRTIVFHGAKYVSPGIAKSGRIGRSFGCMAVAQDVIQPLIKSIKDKALVVAYYPDKKWLTSSDFLS